jgi:hypothetical protein
MTEQSFDHHAMARLARALYEAGHDPRQVMRECYGVAFPDEFFAIAEASPQLMFDFTILPWGLARPLNRGGPPRTTAPLDSLDRPVLVRDPDLIPLGLCLGVDEGIGTGLGGHFLCYRRSELAAGRSTVVSVEFRADPDSPITTRADSLLTALHEHHTANATWMAQWRRRTAGHSGGSIWDDEDLAAAQEFVADIEELQRRLTPGVTGRRDLGGG